MEYGNHYLDPREEDLNADNSPDTQSHWMEDGVGAVLIFALIYLSMCL